MSGNFFSDLEAVFRADPQRRVIETDDGRRYARGDLLQESGRIANLLLELGAVRGERVAVQVDKSPASLCLYLACLRAGLVYLPLNTAYQRGELEYFFADARPRVIVCRDAMLGVCATLARDATVLTLDAHGGELVDRAAAFPETFATVPRAPDDLAAILYTSGTTGRSKGAMLSHRNLASNALALVESWRFSHGDVLLHALPVYHVHGLFVAVHCVLLAGARMLWLARFDAHEVAALLPKATVMMGVPTFYTRLLAEPAFTREVAAHVRLFVSGSAPLLAETFAAFEARTGQRILERYGLTETGMNTSNPYAGPRIAGTVGPPLPGVEVRILDARREPCAPGVVGAIEVRGPNVFRGYWQMPDKTREAIDADGWFATGDLGSWSPERYVVISGRAKDLIISGGLNIYPKEIEERIDALDGVVESAVVGIADADFGEAVVAFVVAKDGHALTEASIVAALRGEIAHFKVPKRVVFALELPRNAMGKVQKNALREKLAAGIA
jgi:malonyl-CoA/methylmalonyl-CoA synthetase